jgi:linoleoyl-CoA desaturase
MSYLCPEGNKQFHGLRLSIQMQERSKALPPIRFNNRVNSDFASTLRKRVHLYFKENGITKYANGAMVAKTVFMFSLFWIPYVCLYFVSSGWLTVLCYALMGTGMAGIGLSVMHDANHGAYSQKKWVNSLMGYALNMLGGNATNWKIQHNVLHHTYTNIHTHDEDIRPRHILRFSPHSTYHKFHKYQHIYAWPLYGLMTVSWILFKDFGQLYGYHKSGLLEKQVNPAKAWFWLIATKVFYLSYIVVLPIIFGATSFWMVLLGFFIMHYVAGFILATVFQPAHVLEANLFPEANKEDEIEENFMVHQIKTTANFARKNKPFSWFVGGLNYQIEHHLFPNICHIHYSKLAEIVKKTAAEFNVPYRDIPSFRTALALHGRMLYKLGQSPAA